MLPIFLANAALNVQDCERLTKLVIMQDSLLQKPIKKAVNIFIKHLKGCAKAL
jgi:hypothetical protein